MFTIRTITIAIAVAGTGGCLYDGKGTAGLPCNVDADCSAQFCVEHICGGPAAASGDSSGSGSDSDGSGSDGAEQPTPQVFEDACDENHQACIGSNAIEYCSEGKLIRIECEATCGMGDPVQGGCQTDPRDGVDYCWCESNGGPPNGTCGEACSGDGQCSSNEDCYDGTCVPSLCQSCFDSGYTNCQWEWGHNCTNASCA